MLMRFIGRIIWVAITFVISALVAAGVAGVIGLEQATRQVVGADGADADRWMKMFDQATALLPLLGGVTLLAPLALAVTGEVMRIRSFLYYLVGGGVTLAAGPVIKQGGLELFRTGALPATYLQVLAVAGFAAGTVYWLLAGRKA